MSSKTPPSTTVASDEDNLQTGIDNIVEILTSLGTMSENRLETTLSHDDANSTTGNNRRKRRDAEYQAFSCDVHCFLRPVNPYRRRSAHTKRRHYLLECLPSGSDYPTESVYTVTIDCVSHFTGSLVHVVLNLDREKQNQLKRGFVTIGEHFAPTLANIGHFRSNATGPLGTGLYLTLNVPITELTFEDLYPLKSWLKYLALNGEYLRAIDENILTKLDLNYFVLEGCTRNDMVVDKYDDDRAASYNSQQCRVMWRFSCPNFVELEIFADARTQERLCGIAKEGEQTRVSVEHRSRRRRSPRPSWNNPSSEKEIQLRQTTQTVQSTLPAAPRLSVSVEERDNESNVRVREDILWYQTAILVLFGLLALLIILMTLMVIVFSIFIRKTWREKLKPV